MREKKETILIVHNYYQIPGGEDTVVENEKKILEEHGHKVILYTRNNSELGTMNALKKILLPFVTIFNIRTYYDIKKIIKKDSIDIVHIHNTLNLVSPSVYYAAVTCSIPVVQTLHNFRMLCPAAVFYRDGHICEECLSNGLKSAIKHNCYRNSKIQTLACVITTLIHRKTGIYKKINFICLTEFNKKKLLQLNNTKKIIDEKKIYIKPNFTFDVDSTLNLREISDYYMFIGRLEQIKGISIILNAFSKLKHIKLKIAGTCELTKIFETNLDNIEYLGYLNRKRLLKYLKKAKALVVASQVYETFGMNVIEAYACGTPVIAGNIGNIGALVDDGITGLKYIYDNPDCLVDKIIEFENMNSNEINLMRYNARMKFEKNFIPEKNFEILKYIYCSLKNI